LIDLKDYKETGYAVIKDWLNQEECKKFLLDYENHHNRTKSEWETAWPFPFASPDLIQEISSKIYNVCDAVNQVTNQNIDSICPSFTGSNWYGDNSSINYDWHQDFVTYFNQSYKDYIILYVILFKEDTSQSGLDVIPVNRLKKYLSKEQFDRIFDGQGSNGLSNGLEYNKKFYEMAKGTNWPEWKDFISDEYLNDVKQINKIDTIDLESNLDSEIKIKTEIAVKYLSNLEIPISAKTRIDYNLTDEVEYCTFDANDLKESPELNSGDLLLIRGDLFHKTQDQKTRRIALSTRCIDGNTKMSVSKYKNLKVHENFYRNNGKYFTMFEETFEGKEERTAREIYSNMRRTFNGK